MTQQRTKPGQYLALRAKVTETTDSGAMIVKGIASDANETDSFGTRIKLSQRALDEFNNNPILMYNHNLNEPIGKVRSIGYNGAALECEVEIFAGVKTPNGTDIQDLVKRGALNAFSIRFDDYKTRNVGDYTQIDADILDELSLVTLPSNRKSLITMRSKGVQMHGAGEILAEHDLAPVDCRSSNTRAAGPLSLDLLTQKLAAVIREERSEEGGYWDYYGSRAYLVSIYDDYCVWSEYGEPNFFREGYSVDASGVVTLAGDIQEVLPTWTVVGAAQEEVVEVDEADEGTRAKPTDIAAIRMHPDDLQLIVEKVRGLLPTPAAEPPTQAPPTPADQIDLAEGIAAIRSLAPTPDPTPPVETVTLDDVRTSLRALIPTEPGAPASSP